MLFKILFPKKYEELEMLQEEVEFLNSTIEKQSGSVIIPMDFNDVDDDDNPPHFLKGLNPDERSHFINDMERIYADEKFNKIVNYVINVVANYSFQKEPDEAKMRNGRYAVIGIRTLMKQFEDMHSEYQDSKKKDDDFDKFAVL